MAPHNFLNDTLRQLVKAAQKLTSSLSVAGRDNDSTAAASPKQYIVNAVQRKASADSEAAYSGSAVRVTIKLPETIAVKDFAEKKKTPFFKSGKNWIQIIGVAAAVFYAGVSYEQWQDAHAATQVDQRAWVGILGAPADSFNLNPLTTEMQRFQLVKRIGNSGKTPAFEVRVWEHTEIVARGLRPTLAGTYYPPITLFPGQSVDMRPDPIQVTGLVEGGDLTMLRNGSKILYVVGDVSYKDIFGREHHTHFCEFIATNTNGTQPCQFWQEAD